MKENRSAVETLVRDVRYAFRGFRRAPAFTFAAVLTFAVGMVRQQRSSVWLTVSVPQSTVSRCSTAGIDWNCCPH